MVHTSRRRMGTRRDCSTQNGEYETEKYGAGHEERAEIREHHKCKTHERQIRSIDRGSRLSDKDQNQFTAGFGYVLCQK
jgi:hypothetical protein